MACCINILRRAAGEVNMHMSGCQSVRVSCTECVSSVLCGGQKKTPLTQEFVLNFTFISEIYGNVDLPKLLM